MKLTLLLPLVLFCPLIVFADSLIMRDGTRLEGTFLRATPDSITFVERGDKERTLDRRDVQEIVFGNGSGGSAGGSSLDRTGQLNKLRKDVEAAMAKARLTDEQRQTLNDANETLRQAANQSTSASDREVRMAMDNIRYVVSGNEFRMQDRQTILDDLRMLREYRMMHNSGRSGESERDRTR